MSRMSTCAMAVAALLLPVGLAAQEDAETEPPFVYATYFECDSSREWLADTIVEQLFKPIYDQAVEDGTISGWGYLVHNTGGTWRRALYRVAPTLEQAVTSIDAIAEKVAATSAQAAAEFGRICSRHDDYIWRSAAGSQGTDLALERGEVGFSVYYICDEASESEADDIVQETFAPVYDAQVEAGNLVSWGWMEHWVGGKYRRLATMTAADLASLLEARDAIVGSLVENEEAMAAFNARCSGHSDYIWNIELETP